MSQPELLRTVVGVLEQLQIPFMATGSLVSSMQGEPRASHDIDLVVEMEGKHAPQLVAHFSPPDYYLDELAVREAVLTGQMFNLLHDASGDKIDFWMLHDTPFDRSRFARRIPASIFGISLFITKAEDTILQKLLWAKISGGSEKQLADARNVYEAQRRNLDMRYIEHWVLLLDLRELWNRVNSQLF